MESGQFILKVLGQAWGAAWPRWAFAAGGFAIVYFVLKRWFEPRRIQEKRFTWRQFGYEALFSFMALAIANLIGAATRLVVTKGWGVVSTAPVDLPTLGLIVLQFVGYFFLFDAWFYFLHRFMHSRALFWIHRYHHHSMVPDPLSAFSFHPMEALLTGGFIPVMVLVLHPHVYAIIAATTFGVVSSVLVHSGHEPFPRGWYRKGRLTRYWLTPMFHDRHHTTFKYNFGGFTTIWDYLLGTVEPRFEERYEALHDRADAAKAARKAKA